MKVLNMEHLAQFVTVAECRSITQAAEQMMISHPTVSRSVHALEAQFGLRLLRRTSKGTELTDAGLSFYNSAKELLAQAAALEQRMGGLAAGESGKLHVVTFCALGEELLRACRRLFGIDGKIDVTISSNYIFNTRLLDGGEADLFYMFEAPDIDLRDYGTLTLSMDRYCLLISDACPLPARTELSLGEIDALEMPTLWYPQTLEMLGYAVPPTAVDISRRYHNLKSYEEELYDIRVGKIAAIVPMSMAVEAGAGFRYFTIREAEAAGIRRRMLAVWRLDNPNPCLRAFLEILRQEVLPPERYTGLRATC